MKISRLLLLLILLLSCSAVWSQENFIMHINIDKGRNEFKDLLKDKVFKDSAAVIQGIDSLISSFRFKGCLLAETDTLIWNGDQVSAFIKLNQRYFLVNLMNGNVDPRVLYSSGYTEKLAQNKPFSRQELERLFQKLIRTYENQGYPFASARLDSVQVRDSLISARIYVDPGRFIRMDSIYTAGNASLSSQFLHNYLGLKLNSPYNEETVISVDEQLRKLAFIEIVKPSQINFTGDKAKSILFLNKKNANRFDGILGLVPGNRSEKMQLTGDITLQLQNAFRHAEQLGVNFKSFSKQSRELDLHFSMPFIFSSPIGIRADFNLYKQDTSFQNINFRGTALYTISALKKIGFYIEKHSGNILMDTIAADKSYAAINSTLYGLTYSYKKLDKELAPHKGSVISLDGSAGFKKAGSPPGAAYSRSSQYRLETLLDFYFPAGRHGVLRLENRSALSAGKRLYDNELYRIGGFNLLRGFDEKSITASSYSVFNAEYRYMIEQRSFLFLFCNQGFIQRRTIKSSAADTPLGLGAGINLETKAGILSLSYAVGKQKNIPVNLRQGKIHFGLIALF